MWSAGGYSSIDRQLLGDFADATGISVHLIPASESSSQRLRQESNLLASRSAGVDVVQIDTVWVSQLAEHLIDLRSALQDRISDELPDTIENATLRNRIVAAPLAVGYGLLFFRTDLLTKYGFSRPPATWDDLEKQARQIQRGERRSGHSQFWGYVWQGAEYEGLTCNALEWQSSQRGGIFVTAARESNVFNGPAVKAFARAAGWVGTISPPGVIAYMEEDARNVWQSGNAAFMRNWAYVYPLASSDSHLQGRFSVAPIPAQGDWHSSVLGGWYLGVPSFSTRQKDAITFVQYMTSKSTQIRRAVSGGFWPTLKSAYRDPSIQSASSVFHVAEQIATRVVRRPASVLGPLYPCASELYARGVHEILARKASAALGAQRLQAALQNLLNAPRSSQQGCQ